MQMKSTVAYSELIPFFLGKRFARKNMAVVSSGIYFFMSALKSSIIIIREPSYAIRKLAL